MRFLSKRLFLHRLWLVAAFVTFAPDAALANSPPAPQAMLFESTIMPVALVLFMLG
jgi:hypothetical protein